MKLTANKIIKQNKQRQEMFYLATELARAKVVLAILAKHAGGTLIVDVKEYQGMMPPTITLEDSLLTVKSGEPVVKPTPPDVP